MGAFRVSFFCFEWSFAWDAVVFDLLVGELLLPTSDFVFEFAFCVIFCDAFDSFGLFDVFPPCELEESESELDEFDWSESLELPLDDDALELVQLDPVELTDYEFFKKN